MQYIKVCKHTSIKFCAGKGKKNKINLALVQLKLCSFCVSLCKKNTEIWNFKHKETCSNYDMIHVLFLSIELELEQYVTNLFDRHTCTMHLYCRKYTLDLWYSIHSQIKFSYYYLYILCQCSKSKPGDVNHRQQQKFEWFLTKVERSCTTSEISELCQASLDLFRYHTYKHFIIFIWLFVFRELFPIDSIKTFVHCCLIHFLCDRVKQYHEIFYFLFVGDGISIECFYSI